ncbi:hypothetical protein BJY00DRAFT_297445 [Aspergillus carlsbadensis]|nr:hypothetical protein BJY00DRAFT_297445 [Aspergillus carlsbadensis]
MGPGRSQPAGYTYLGLWPCYYLHIMLRLLSISSPRKTVLSVGVFRLLDNSFIIKWSIVYYYLVIIVLLALVGSKVIIGL